MRADTECVREQLRSRSTTPRVSARVSRGSWLERSLIERQPVTTAELTLEPRWLARRDLLRPALAWCPRVCRPLLDSDGPLLPMPLPAWPRKRATRRPHMSVCTRWAGARAPTASCPPLGLLSPSRRTPRRTLSPRSSVGASSLALLSTLPPSSRYGVHLNPARAALGSLAHKAPLLALVVRRHPVPRRRVRRRAPCVTFSLSLVKLRS